MVLFRLEWKSNMDLKAFLRQIVCSIGRFHVKPSRFSAFSFTICLLYTSFLIVQLRDCHHFNHKLYVLQKDYPHGVGCSCVRWWMCWWDQEEKSGGPIPHTGVINSVLSPLCLGSPALPTIKNGSFELKRLEYDETHPRIKPKIVTASSVGISFILS